MHFKHLQQRKKAEPVPYNQVCGDSDAVLNAHALPTEKGAWLHEKRLFVDFVLVHHCVETLLCLHLLLGGVLVRKQHLNRLLFRLADNLHVLQHLRPLLLEGGRYTSVEDARVGAENDLRRKREVLRHKGLLLLFAIDLGVLLVQREGNRNEFCAVVADHHRIDTFF